LEKTLSKVRSLGLDPVHPDVHPSQYSSEIIKWRDRVSIVFVGGGDGSVNAAIDGLIETQLPLVVIPLGTANNLARNLGLPLDPE
jgi:diacylglycerol kinase family enzyme